MNEHSLIGARRLVLAVVSLGLFGCDDPLSQVEAIDKTRVVAAKVEVGGDPTRAAPLPGEDVTVRFLVIAPNPTPDLAYALTACVAADSAVDLTTCAGEPLATAASLSPGSDAPSIVFPAPADATGDERLAVLGGVCPDGVALPDAAATRCADGSAVLGTTLDFSMDDGAHPNTNPALTSFRFDGAELGPGSAATTDCAELPSVRSGSPKHRLNVDVDPSSRDPIARASSSDPARESLLVSYFVTRGDMDHAWSAIDADASSNTTGSLWSAPTVTAPALARFVVVVRDGRGGSDFLERRVCIQPD
ncbi:MAG TPA: hypothetical protein VGQ57_16505 [Polyangiaceae bacterium]|jgi:hypothetical protein|nr:hypothetical protein [Polyangiaceae bacterium]